MLNKSGSFAPSLFMRRCPAYRQASVPRLDRVAFPVQTGVGATPAKKRTCAKGKNAMFEILDRRTSLTGNQIKILAAAIIGDALEFFDYFLIGFVLAFLIGPWKLTFGQSATVLMSSGIGAIMGAYVWGWLADRIGRRKVFIGTVLNFSVATGLLYFTPDNGWIYLSLMRFFVGVGVGGLYCVDLPLVQEFMPSSKRGWVGGIVTCVIPLGVGLGAVMGALLGSGDWRLLFAIGVLPALLVLLVRLWVPESPRWHCRRADRRLWHYALGTLAVRAAFEGDAAGGRQDDDPAFRLRLYRPAVVLVFLGVDGTAQRRRPARLRGRCHDHRGGLQLRRGDHGRVGVLAAARRGFLLCRRRLCHRWALCGGSLAVAFEDHRHGFGLRLRRHRQDHRAGRPRVDRGLGQLSEARRAIAGNSAGLRLSRLLVLDGRGGVLFPRNRNQGQVDRADRQGVSRHGGSIYGHRHRSTSITLDTIA